MKHWIACAAILVITTLTAASQESGQPALNGNDLEIIQRLEDEWNTMNEVSDVEGKRRILAEDSYHVGPSGRLYNKTQDLEETRRSFEQKKKEGSVTRFQISNRIIRVYSDAAVVTATGRSIVTLDGNERRGNPFRVVHVWEKRGGNWRLVVDQVTAVR